MKAFFILNQGNDPLGKRSNLLIAGGAGYIGSHAVKEAKKFGFYPITYDNLSMGHRWAVQDGLFVKGDLADRTALIRVFRRYKPVAVMHFASHISVGESVQDPQKYYRDNLGNALNLLSAMLEVKIQYFVFSSTAAVYGDPVQIPMPENHPKNPVNPYGDSKYILERILTWYDQAYGLKSTFLRYFNASGADISGSLGEAHQPESHLIPLILDAVAGLRKEITVFGTDYPTPDGTCIRDYIHVTDLAVAHFLALKHMIKMKQSDFFNLGTGRGYSVQEVINKVQKITGLNVPVKIGARRAGDPPRLIAQSHKAQKVLKWKPRHSDLGTILQTAWRWHQKWHRTLKKGK